MNRLPGYDAWKTAAPDDDRCAPKHTPGPWRINAADRTEIVSDLDPMVIARTPVNLYQREAALANARLIASAPDMYEALKRQFENIGRWRETGVAASPEESESIYEQTVAALTKADRW